MGFFSSIIDKAGKAVTNAGEPAVLIQQFPLPNHWGTVKVYPSTYRVFLRAHAVQEFKDAGNFATIVSTIVSALTAGSGGMLAPVGASLATYMTLEWTAIQHAADSLGVTLCGQYLPPTGRLAPVSGES
jgi:hypothetical protein